MITLLFVQTLLLAILILLMFYWKVHTSSRLRSLRESSASFLASEQRMQTVLLNLQLELNELKQREPVLLTHAATTIPAHEPPQEATLTIAKRSQALKMIRRGDPAESVAAALNVPRSHIQLLIKVQDLIQGRMTPPISATGSKV